MSKLFYHRNDSVIYDTENIIGSIDGTTDIDFPFDFDTEFANTPSWKFGDCETRQLLTAQIKGVNESVKDVFVYSSKFFNDQCRARKEKNIYRNLRDDYNFIFEQYLNDNGFKVRTSFEEKLNRKNYRDLLKKKGYKTLTVVAYAHFAVADYFKLGNEIVEDVLKLLTLKKEKRGSVIECVKRLNACLYDSKGEIRQSVVHLPFICEINGFKYLVKFKIVDTCALHGVASYEQLLEATGFDKEIIDTKKSLSQDDKENMLETYFKNPTAFDEYAKNDLYVHEILRKNKEKSELIYEALGLKEYFKVPGLTIGATVKNLLVSFLLKQVGLSESDRKTLEEICKPASSKYLAKAQGSLALTAKVFGGRCRNNQPNRCFIGGVIIDFDIMSCYGNGLRHQSFFIGTPTEFSYSPLQKSRITLRQFLKQFENEMEYGKFQIIVSSKTDLVIEQDLIQSWFNFKRDKDGFLDVKSGEIKIFNNQIINGLITADILDVIEHVYSPKQRDELLDKLEVEAAIYYAKSKKVETLKEYLEAIDKGIKDAYIEIPLGKLVDDLIAFRTLYKVVLGKKCSYEQMFKLHVNTIYGVLASKFFDVSNVIVANNITARARVMCWLMEKGLNGVLSITDGCQVDINKIVHALNGVRLYGDKLVNLYQHDERSLMRNKRIVLKPLGGYKEIKYDSKNQTISFDDDVLPVKEAFVKLSDLAIKHLKTEFPKVRLLHSMATNLEIEIDKSEIETIKSKLLNNEIVIPKKVYKPCEGFFSLEIKCVADKMSFHGTSNYFLNNGESDCLKMRSYENKQHHEINLKNKDSYIELSNQLKDFNKKVRLKANKDLELPSNFENEYDESQELKLGNRYLYQTPAYNFLVDNLLVNPNNVQRQKVFSKKAILKPGDYSNNDKYVENNLIPGDTIVKYGILREFSLSQFTFKNLRQFEAIKKEHSTNLRRYGQSFEMYFLNDDGTLRYEDMIKTIDELIHNGCVSINKHFDKSMHRHRKNIYHPEFEVLEVIKNYSPKINEYHDDYEEFDFNTLEFFSEINEMTKDEIDENIDDFDLFDNLFDDI